MNQAHRRLKANSSKGHKIRSTTMIVHNIFAFSFFLSVACLNCFWFYWNPPAHCLWSNGRAIPGLNSSRRAKTRHINLKFARSRAFARLTGGQINGLCIKTRHRIFRLLVFRFRAKAFDQPFLARTDGNRIRRPDIGMFFWASEGSKVLKPIPRISSVLISDEGFLN